MPESSSSSPADQSSVSVEWFDASESTPPKTGGLLSVKVVNGGVEAFWNGAKLECVKETISSPIKTNQIFPELSSRSPTSRFRIAGGHKTTKSSSLRTLNTRLHHHRFVLKSPKRGGGERKVTEELKTEMTADEKEAIDEKEGHLDKKDEDPSAETEILEEKSEENGPAISTQLSTPDVLSDIPLDILGSGGSSNSPPTALPNDAVAEEDVEEEEEEGDTTSSIPANNSSTDAADMKRQKKKERKKARQLNREQQMKRQRLQRTEALKSLETKLEKEKRQLAEYAAAVAKPTITQQQNEKEQYTIEVCHQTDGSISICGGGGSKDAPMRIHVPHDIRGMIELKVDPNMQMSEMVQVESLETFEVLVCGERRKVTPFIPRKKQNSGGTDATAESSTSSSNTSVFDIPEHPPVVVPFRDAPIVGSGGSNQAQAPPPPHQAPPQYVTMPMTFQSQPNHPVLVSGPIYAPPPRYLPAPFGQPPPPPQYSMGILPVAMQRIPMQRMPVMMNQRPIFVAPPPQGAPQRVQMAIHVGPTPQRPIHHIQSFQQAPPVQQPLVRPPRTPLAITAPPLEEKKEAKKKKKTKKVATESFAEEIPKEDVPTAPEVSPEVSEQAETVIIEETIILEQAPPPQPVRRTSSTELNGELITSNVSAILDETDDEIPTSSAPTTLRPLSPTSEAQQAAINRVLGFSKPSEDSTFNIWAGWINEMPPAPIQKTSTSSDMERSFKKILEEDEKKKSQKELIVEGLEKKWREEQEETEKQPNLVSICKKIESYFM
ncbi:hypothetical protein GCK72_000429 [Caenorhabditis remanei]|uniref:Uncharacterized protein n=1 Tax=Caenorhabditis remanei TaxID=31234 RepID=A0A6A5HQN1_CAERE|nr:hypothetical protein GCK72_000429 [Caenorhabditis remanei]KAF1768617.1 hypothetical protein GCK72_000429 [Caenorhabditis remanei]